MRATLTLIGICLLIIIGIPIAIALLALVMLATFSPLILMVWLLVRVL